MNEDFTYILVPAYNEAEVIREVLESLVKLRYKVVVIDDGSMDNTEEVIRGFQGIPTASG